MMDKYFRVEVLEQTQNPQQLIYAAMHQDYSENFVWDEVMEPMNMWLMGEMIGCAGVEFKGPNETECGNIIVTRLLAGHRGHYGPLEHPQITLNCGWFPHSTMQQIRTHRVGISVDCQSFRYTGKRIVEVAEGVRDVEEVFYLRPVNTYSDRQGNHYSYDTDWRERDKEWCLAAAKNYALDIKRGKSEEHARGIIPFDVRQHWVLSCNVRSLMHLLDLRAKADAQLEAQQLCELIWPHFQAWVPAIADWYEKNRLHKARLAP